MGQAASPFECDLCGDAFVTESARSEHVFAAHVIGEDDA